MRICVIGSSGHYGYVLRALDRGCEIVAISPGCESEDMTPLKRDLAKLGFSPREYTDHRRMLDEERPDVVVLNTFFSLNGKILKETLKRKVHTFVEKPIATTMEDLEEIKGIYQQVRDEVFFAAMFGIRYKAHFLTAKKLLDDGIVGEVRLVNTQKSYKLGERPEFYRRRETFGGTILWVGIHAIDWINWLTRKKFLKVYAVHSRKANRGHGDLEATALCLFTLEDEVFASLTVDYLRPSGAPTHDDDRVRIVGTKGVLEVRDGKVFVIDDRGSREVPLLEEGQIFRDFLKRVRNEGECMVTPEDFILATEVALKARLSADTGQIIEI